MRREEHKNFRVIQTRINNLLKKEGGREKEKVGLCRFLLLSHLQITKQLPVVESSYINFSNTNAH